MSKFMPFHNAAFSVTVPVLSVLIPFYKESPVALLRALRTCSPQSLEIILLDDGSNQPELTEAVSQEIAQSPLACELISLAQNEGRARGRNRLTSAARGRYFLFLDSDMLPDRRDFLDTWLGHCQSLETEVIFGGFSLLQAPATPEFSVHRAMAGHSDCLEAAKRSLHPEKYVFTSNLLIRRDIFETEGFDANFTGWGWEDVEWAMRVSSKYRIGHIDNTATHMGLDSAASLARKYEQSVPNFARVIARHPHIVAHYPSYKVAKSLSRVPLLAAFRGLIKALALNSVLPLKLRALSLRLYRAALYAEVV